MTKLFSLSLRLRLLLSVALTLLLFLGITGLVLDRAMTTSVMEAAQSELRLRLYSLMSEVEADQGRVTMPLLNQDQQLNDPHSGVLAVILDGDQRILWQSQSSSFVPEVLNLALTLKPAAAGEFQTHQLEHGDNQWLVKSYPVNWIRQSGTLNLTFMVMEDSRLREATLSGFRTTLWLGFFFCGLSLLLSLLLLVRWNLLPLRSLSLELSAIRSGQADKILLPYPKELQSVTQNLNLLLAAEQDQRRRYRDRLSDLAHSLKTPLANLSAQTTGLPEHIQQSMTEQVMRMDQIVQYQLKRTLGGEQAVHLELTPLASTTERLFRVLQHAFDPSPQLSLEVDEQLKVPMAEDDCMEVLGNLLENAAKYGNGQILVTSHQHGFSVEDDGPGIPEDQRELVLQRGVRMDTLKPGQGIGLAVVSDILASYRAQLAISTSPLGGARFTITFAPLPS